MGWEKYNTIEYPVGGAIHSIKGVGKIVLTCNEIIREKKETGIHTKTTSTLIENNLLLITWYSRPTLKNNNAKNPMVCIRIP